MRTGMRETRIAEPPRKRGGPPSGPSATRESLASSPPPLARLASTLRTRPLAALYLGTAALAVPDFLIGFNIRCAFWSGEPVLRLIYYGGCLGLGLAALRVGPRMAAGLGLTESVFNLTMIIAAIILPIYVLPAQVASGEIPASPYGLQFVLNAAISAAVFLRMFYTNPLVRSSPRLDDNGCSGR